MAYKRALLGCCLAAALVAAGCSGGGGPTLSPTDVQSRYMAAVGPANSALGDMVQRSLEFSSGAKVNMNSGISPTSSALRTAISKLGGINATAPVRQDMRNVSTAMNQVVGDLNTLKNPASTELQGDIARFVADAGAVAAAENVVELALDELTTGTIPPPPPTEATFPTTTTSVEPLTPTTRARRATITTRRTTTTTLGFTTTPIS